MNARLVIILTTTLTGVWAVINLPFWPAFILGWVVLVIIAAALTPEAKEKHPHDRNL